MSTFCIVVLVNWVPKEATLFIDDEIVELGPEPATWLAENSKLLATELHGGQEATQLLEVLEQ